ncbi:hypothetical protein glysoja_011676 [Glycine soja]|nr:hypothetical protein glysoja_011676 [Glycine soja]
MVSFCIFSNSQTFLQSSVSSGIIQGEAGGEGANDFDRNAGERGGDIDGGRNVSRSGFREGRQ